MQKKPTKTSRSAAGTAQKNGAGSKARGAAKPARQTKTTVPPAKPKKITDKPATPAVTLDLTRAQAAICGIGLAMAEGRTLVKTLEDALREFCAPLSCPAATVLELSPDESSLNTLASFNAPLMQAVPVDEPVEIVAKRGPSVLLGTEWRGGICLPLLFQDVPQGMLCLGKLPVRPGTALRGLLELLTGQLALALYTSRINGSNDLELQFTHALKAELLSEVVPQIPDFAASLHLLRCPEGGGDFHDFLPLQNGRVAITIGKTSGWGVKASLNLAHLIPTARGQLTSGRPLAEVMQNLNEDIIRHGNRGQLVSIVMMLLDSRTRKARICRAGSVKMLRFKGGVLSIFDEALGPHLGAFSGVRLKEVEMQFAPGDSLALMTDGINKFAEKKDFTLEKLSERLASRMENTAGSNLADQVVAMLKENTAANNASDVTVLGIQRLTKKNQHN